MDRKNIKTNPLLESYREHIERIDKALEAELNLYVESEFTEPLKYAIADGKRIRAYRVVGELCQLYRS